jgi:hypothetical protein
MLTAVLKTIFTRDLEKLKLEIEAYKDEAAIWHIEKSVANSAGNLCLHLVGNLNTYIGAQFGNTGYVRNRPLEFSLKNIPRAELLQKIDETIVAVNHGLDMITGEDLTAEYPMQVFDNKTSTEYFLVHLASHLGYHLGQVNYHRRLLDVQG